MPGLCIGLIGDFLGQFIGQLGHIHQLGPWPCKARAELGNEMRHTGFAAGDAVGFKKPHLCPAQAKAITDGIVNFFRGGDAVLDQPKPFAPYRF